MTVISIAAGSSVSVPLPANSRLFITGQGVYCIGPLGTSQRPTVDELIDEFATVGPFADSCTVQIRATGSGATYDVVAPSDAAGFDGRPALVSGAGVSVSASRDITAADNGLTLLPTGTLTLTIPAGLTPEPSFTVDCPASGTVSIAVSGGATINGATTTLTRSRAANPVGFVVLAHAEADSYGVSGS